MTTEEQPGELNAVSLVLEEVTQGQQSESLSASYLTLEEEMQAFNELFNTAPQARSFAIGASTSTAPRLFVPGVITGVQDVDFGLNYNLVHSNIDGLPVTVQQYAFMKANDFIEVCWHSRGASALPVKTWSVTADQVGNDVSLYIPAELAVVGVGELYVRVRRAGSENAEESRHFQVLYRRTFPGGPDRRPNEPWHSELAAPQVPARIRLDTLGDYVEATVAPWLNMHVRDTLVLSWFGQIIRYVVGQAQVGRSVVVRVPAARVIEAGDAIDAAVVYQVYDEVHNVSEKWSAVATVDVELDEDLLDPARLEAYGESDLKIIDLDRLEKDDVRALVRASRPGFRVGDSIQLMWRGVSAQGQAVEVKPLAQKVTALNIDYGFDIVNSDVAYSGGGHAVAWYTVLRNGAVAGKSLRNYVDVKGGAQRLPVPKVLDAPLGVLDPALALARVVITAYAGMSAGDRVRLYWLGTTATGVVEPWDTGRTVSGNTVGKDLEFDVPASQIGKFDGGSVQVYYEVKQRSTADAIESRRLMLQVGELCAELPAPLVPAASADGTLDPALPGRFVKVEVKPYARIGEDDEVSLQWHGSSASSSWSDTLWVWKVNETLVFEVPQSVVQAGAGEVIDVRYTVRGKDGKVRLSKVKLITLGQALKEPLPIPVVPQATQSGGTTLDPENALNGITVEVAYMGMLPTDQISLHFGSKQNYAQLPGQVSGKVVFAVPAVDVGAVAGQQVAITYFVARNGRTYMAAILHLNVLAQLVREDFTGQALRGISQGQNLQLQFMNVAYISGKGKLSFINKSSYPDMPKELKGVVLELDVSDTYPFAVITIQLAKPCRKVGFLLAASNELLNVIGLNNVGKTVASRNVDGNEYAGGWNFQTIVLSPSVGERISKITLHVRDWCVVDDFTFHL